MYPQRELTRLNAYKMALQRDISWRRAQCKVAATQIAKPFELLDRMLVLWHRLSPFALFAAMPLGILVQRTVARRMKILGSLVRWSPLVFTAMRRISALVTTTPVSFKNRR